MMTRVPARPIARLYSLCAFWLAGALPLASQALPVAPGPVDGPYPGFEVRYGLAPIPNGAELSALIGKPTLVASFVRNFIDPGTGGKVIEAMGEAHAVYDISLAALASVLEVDEAQAKFGSGILAAHVDLKQGNRSIVYQELGTNFLGIKVSYKTRSEVFRDDLPGGAVGFRARLIESPDGKLYESFSSWYLVPVVIAGKEYLYVRTFMRSGIRNPFLGAETIMGAFIPKQSADMIVSNIKEARRRQKGQ
jgi:hypothetical protein